MSSTTPPPPQASLTERRKAETRMEIARAAAGLFVRHGLRATRAEDIAQAAGIAPRTFYRYFATKEEAVAPLYAAGAQRWVEAVRAAPAGDSVPRALEHGVRQTLTPGVGVSASSWEWVRTLLRLAEANPSLRRVWAEVCQASERTLGEVLAERGSRRGSPEGDDNVAAVTEPHVGAPEPHVGVPPEPHVGVPPEPHVGVPPEPRLAVPPEPRFAAAVASAAVRTALEGWAEGDGPVEGAGSPAELALRNLRALRDFPWEA
ncbi:TetR/AcrR family transcriptional regulator [Streptomyces sp. DH10]|uniref:TetR/AcrR family transcriptional regulator n=1 Tax=Streptomyces sp. DH10 TaxID=3040121 RepID=UPI002441BC48|nr:TetR/AcrR family transcriptional regulator [Streptomyces sp. DH10]MDG9707704.1 TetR/AcrR family transcriptional regulator [Streptomyces sp. DH10]